jgi:hypothetical protein
MRAHRVQSYTCAAAGENESGDGRARAWHAWAWLVFGGAEANGTELQTFIAWTSLHKPSPRRRSKFGSTKHMPRSAYVTALFLACCGTCCCMRLTPIAPLSRRSCLSAAALAAIPLAGASAAESAQTLALLKEARAQLDACDGLIADGSWDMVRTVVKTPPLVNAKNLITEYIKVSGEAAEDLVVPRQELVQSLQLLDMNVYNNVFVGEQNGQGKKGSGKRQLSTSRRTHILCSLSDFT